MDAFSEMEGHSLAAGKQLRDERQCRRQLPSPPSACGGGCIPLVPQTHSRNFTSSGPELIRSGSFCARSQSLLANVGGASVLEVQVEVRAMHVVEFWPEHGGEAFAGSL